MTRKVPVYRKVYKLKLFFCQYYFFFVLVILHRFTFLQFQNILLHSYMTVTYKHSAFGICAGIVLYGMLHVALFDIFTLLFYLIYLYLSECITIVYFSICSQYPFISIAYFPFIFYILSFVFYNFHYFLSFSFLLFISTFVFCV